MRTGNRADALVPGYVRDETCGQHRADATSCVSSSATVGVDIQARLGDNHATFVLTICLGVAVAIIVGLIAGIIVRFDGATMAKAIMKGAYAAAVAATLATGVITLLSLMS
ncbi:hypothetical protein [Nocardia altamirensis]|uniref:hypothetical protein n=1 Tax=Nocardia altamirensis TaxID=472158 RepID=UPI000840063F|nr:hypothetical protein [Nocardia altamirensis]